MAAIGPTPTQLQPQPATVEQPVRPFVLPGGPVPQPVVAGTPVPPVAAAPVPEAPPALKPLLTEAVGRPEFFQLTPQGQREVVRRLIDANQGGAYSGLSPAAQERVFQTIIGDPEIRGRAFGEIKKAPGLAERAAREAPAIAGGLAGGVAGTALTGTPIGGILGATAGAGGAEAVTQRVVGEPVQPGRIAARAGEALGGEIAGRTALRLVGNVLAPFSRTVRGPATAGQRALATLSPHAPAPEQGMLGTAGVRGLAGAMGVKELPIRPAQATESRALEILQNVAEGSMFGGSGLTRLRDVVEPDILLRGAADLIESAGPLMDADQLAAALTAGIENRIEARNLVIRPLYNAIDTAAPGLTADVTALKAFAKPLAQQAKRLRGVGQALSVDDDLARLATLPDTIPFADMSELRSRLLAAQRALEATPGASTKDSGRLARLVALTDDATSQALQSQRPDLLPIWRDANKLVKEREKELNSRFIRGLVRAADPERVGAGGGKPEALINSVFRSPTTARQVRRALGKGSQEWQGLQRGYVSTLLEPNPKTGQIVGKELRAKLVKTGDTLREIEPQLRKRLFEFAEAAVQQQRVGSRVGKVGIQLIQFGPAAAVGGALLTFNPSALGEPGVAGPLVAAILAPSMIGRLLAHPVAGRLLIKGMKASPATREVAGMLGQLATIAARESQALESLGVEPQLRPQEIQPPRPPGPLGARTAG